MNENIGLYRVPINHFSKKGDDNHMTSQPNQQLRHSQRLLTGPSPRFQVLFLGDTDQAVDAIETQDINVEEIIACINLGGSVFITGIPQQSSRVN
jgi:hypothetical protein